MKTQMTEEEADEWLEQLINRIPIKDRIGTASAQEVMSSFAPEDFYGGLPIAMLRALSKEYIDSLPEDLQARIRQRLRDETH